MELHIDVPIKLHVYVCVTWFYARQAIHTERNYCLLSSGAKTLEDAITSLHMWWQNCVFPFLDFLDLQWGSNWSNLLNTFSLGAPVYYSSPHFLYGTESLFEGVIGMNPVKEEHMVYFDIQMVSLKINICYQNWTQIKMLIYMYWINTNLKLNLHTQHCFIQCVM